MEAVAAAAPSDRPIIAQLPGAVAAAESSERGGISIAQDGQGQEVSVLLNQGYQGMGWLRLPAPSV